MSRESRRRKDVVLMGMILLVILSLALVLVRDADRRMDERRKYQECVQNIAPYLDAQEILYQEQECGWGVQAP